MRIAALYDIHGNLPALDAALADVQDEGVDAIVLGGDMVWGPLPEETAACLMGLRHRVHLVRGNSDREVVAAFDVGARFDPAAGDATENVTAWTAERLGEKQRAFLASARPVVTLELDGLGRTLFCHATPTSDEELFTRLTPVAELEALFDRVEASLVVCGHTHSQFERRVGSTRVVNAGSVGMPYEDEPGAYWALLGPEVELRRTPYDLEAAATAVRASGFPMPHFAEENVLTVPAREEAESHFERLRLARCGA